jgi:hypothetical protein
VTPQGLFKVKQAWHRTTWYALCRLFKQMLLIILGFVKLTADIDALSILFNFNFTECLGTEREHPLTGCSVYHAAIPSSCFLSTVQHQVSIITRNRSGNASDELRFAGPQPKVATEVDMAFCFDEHLKYFIYSRFGPLG